MKSTRRKSKIAGLFLALLVLIITLGAFAVTAFAADGDTAAVTVIEGYGPDSDDSEFGTALGNKIISGTNNATSWIDDTGKGNLYFQWGYGDALDVALIDPNGVISYESVIIQEHSDPEMRYDAHWMEFALSGACADDTYIVATRGFDEYIRHEEFTTGEGSVANVFTQTASGDPSFLSNYMLMHGEDYITDGSTSLSFKHIPATFRFVITNTHEEALSLESVTLHVVDADGNSVPVASQHCMIQTDAQVGYSELTYSDKTYDSITTNLSGYTLEVGESYLAYALALPLQSDDALTDKTIQVEVTTSEGQCIAFELAAEDIANANPNNEYNWVGEKSYTFRVGTRCADGCTLNATGNCTVCGYECIHDYDNGFCTVCDVYEPAPDSNSDGYYEVASAGHLFWYANYINTVDRTANAVLTADIDLENRPWTPIGVMGEDSNSFHGVFDGQYHTITGLNVTATSNGAGFFGEVRTGTVKNFTIYGEMVVNAEVDYVGGVIGSICGLNGENDLERNGAIIQNITSFVNVTAKAHGIGMIGGFVGYANHQSLIEKCAWYGTFDAGEYRVDSGAGGFIGKIQENTSEVTIRNCGAYGTIKTGYEKNSYNNYATIYMGGFLSFSNTDAKTTLENCLFAGRFERGANLTDQAFLGAFGTLRSVNAIKNCYYLGDDGLAAVHSDSDLKPGSDNVEITSVTEEQLKSGEVAWLLNGSQSEGVWKQNVGIDPYPSFTGNPVTKGDSEDMPYYNDGVVRVNISWTEMSFTYTVGQWDPETHTSSGGGWTADKENGGQITVTNSGGTNVPVSFTFQGTMGDVSGIFTVEKAALAMGQSVTTTLSVTGDPKQSGFQDAQIGTVTVSLGSSGWAVGDKVTMYAKDGNDYVSTVAEVTGSKAVLVSDTSFSKNYTPSTQEDILALVDGPGARWPISGEAAFTNIINPWLVDKLPKSSGNTGNTYSVFINDGTYRWLYKGSLGYVNIATGNWKINYKNTWIGRYIWDIPFAN